MEVEIIEDTHPLIFTLFLFLKVCLDSVFHSLVNFWILDPTLFTYFTPLWPERRM